MRSRIDETQTVHLDGDTVRGHVKIITCNAGTENQSGFLSAQVNWQHATVGKRVEIDVTPALIEPLIDCLREIGDVWESLKSEAEQRHADAQP